MPNHGSLQNHIAANAQNSVVPEVGMGATIVGWTDRYAATIVEVSKSKATIAVQYDNVKRTDSNGMSEAQSYEYTSNPDAHKQVYTLRKNGRYVRKGDPLKGGGTLLVGVRNHYHDFSF